MLSRRTLLSTAAAAGFAGLTGACATTGGAAPTASDPAEAARLTALFDAFMDESLDRSPEGVTSLGLDTGERAAAKAQLDDRSLAASVENERLNAEQLRRLRTIDRNKLGALDRVNYDSVLFSLQTADAANRAFEYGGGGAGSPYAVSQLTGAYTGIPDFLDSQHKIESREDAEAYLSRLSAFARALDQNSEMARHDAGLGVIPPDFAIDRALTQLTGLRNTGPAESVLVQSVGRRTREKNIAGDYAGRATAVYEREVRPALDRQIGLLRELRGRASHDAGVWKLPQGAEYYAHSLRTWTTTERTPDEIHDIGLELVASTSAEIGRILSAQGMTQGPVGQRIRALYTDPRFLYENTDAAKERLIRDLNEQVRVIRGKLPEYFVTLPRAEVEIRRVPAYTEAGAPGGYYNSPSLDGSRPGAYYINLRNTAEVPTWTLPTLTYHEAIPGHHLQIAMQQEAPLPLIRKVGFFSAYIEGWALYAEQLADEMGMYASDPFGRVGYLQSALFRSARLVVDTGIHHKRWSREQAIRYMTETLGDAESTVTTEVERYSVWPGQACTYMLGKVVWVNARERAKTRLGQRFDIRQFHEVGLRSGGMPLAVLDRVIDAWAAAQTTA